MRSLVLLMSALLLGACTNMVRSETPWFSPADAAGAPILRDGVWAAVDPDCGFDAGEPLEQWPACAHGRVVRGGEELSLSVVTYEDARGRLKRAEYDWSSEAFVLAAGAPRIHQRACGAPGGVKEPEDAAGEVRNEAVSRLVYCYAGLSADALDAEGRIVAFTSWPIWCGPMSRRAEGANGPNVTEAPFAELTVVGEHCVAENGAALRAAATASETLETPDGHPSPGAVRVRWVRDGWR